MVYLCLGEMLSPMISTNRSVVVDNGKPTRYRLSLIHPNCGCSLRVASISLTYWRIDKRVDSCTSNAIHLNDLLAR